MMSLIILAGNLRIRFDESVVKNQPAGSTLPGIVPGRAMVLFWRYA